MKTTIPFLLPVLLLTACSHGLRGDVELRAQIIGTWTTADVFLPDQARVSDVTTVFEPDGSWVNRYTITRTGESRKQTTRGSWHIENGFMFELQTNIDGVPDTIEHQGNSKIIQLDGHEMILSNWYSPHRVFLKKP